MNKKNCHHKDEKTHNHASCVNEEQAGDFLKRFFIVGFLLIPLLLGTEIISKWIGTDFFRNEFLKLFFASVIFYYSLVFFKHAWMEIKRRRLGMMSLVSMAVFSGFAFSVSATFIESLDGDFYLEISTLIWILLFGHFLEAKSSGKAGQALKEVASLLPKKVLILKDGKEFEIETSELKEGDRVLIKAGGKIPADGKIIKGEGGVNESLISGESKPVFKKINEKVYAGSILLNGYLEIILTKVGKDSTVGHIYKLVEKAQQTKPRSQRLADIISGYLTIIALVVALLAFAVWFLIIGKSLAFSITIAITVLVVTCPHALGLAIPVVSSIGTSLAVKNGIFIKDLSKIETINKITHVVFDKTGTLTEGRFSISRIFNFSDKREEDILRIVGSLEKKSSHIIALSILDEIKKRGVTIEEAENIETIDGKGIKGKVFGEEYLIGNISFLKDNGIKIKDFDDDIKGTRVYLANKDKVLALLVLSDGIKKDAKKTIKELKKMGLKTVMISGDNEEIAKEVSEELGLDIYFSEVMPDDKYKYIKKIQEEGGKVLMVGDGINDAPALTQADVGLAIGSGTEVALESGDVVLLNSKPYSVVKLIKLSEKIYIKMKQNLWWAFGYNIVFIPMAAGIFYRWGIMLSPEVAAIFMTASDIIVVLNAMLLKRVDLD